MRKIELKPYWEVIPYDNDGAKVFELSKRFDDEIDAEKYAREILKNRSDLYRADLMDFFGHHVVFYKNDEGLIWETMLKDFPDLTFEESKKLEYDYLSDKFFWGKKGLEYREKKKKRAEELKKLPMDEREKIVLEELLPSYKYDLKRCLDNIRREKELGEIYLVSAEIREMVERGWKKNIEFCEERIKRIETRLEEIERALKA